MPRVLWSLLVYEVAVSRVEAIERRMNSWWRKWLRLPRMLTDVAFFTRSGALCLPTRSIVEEYKCGKVRFSMMMQDSMDVVISSARPEVVTGKKWQAEVAAEEARRTAEFSEVVGATQTDRSGIGYGKKRKWWSKADARERRELTVNEVRRTEERSRLTKAVQQPVQGAWTTWEDVVERKLMWTDIWGMSESALKFLVGSTYDVLPTPVNLKRWGKVTSAGCPECSAAECSLEHVLSACPAALRDGRYTWRHDRVLAIIMKVVQQGLSETGSMRRMQRQVQFVREGDSVCARKKQSHTVGSKWKESAEGWQVQMDTGGCGTVPEVIVRTDLRPDIVAWSEARKVVAFVELTVPWETRIALAHERKLEKYSELQAECQSRGWVCWSYAVEVGCRGFIGRSMLKLLQDVGVAGATRKAAIQKLQEAAEVGSAWVLAKAKEKWRGRVCEVCCEGCLG